MRAFSIFLVSTEGK